jgi:hypothetical protein
MSRKQRGSHTSSPHGKGIRIDVDQLTEPELVDRNRRIVERLGVFHQLHATSG